MKTNDSKNYPVEDTGHSKMQEDLKEEISLASRKMLLEACEPKPGEKLYNAAVYAGRGIGAGLVMGSMIGGPYGAAAGGIIGAIGAIGDYSIANKASQMECVKNKLQTW